MFGKRRDTHENVEDDIQLQAVLSNRLRSLASGKGKPKDPNRLEPRKRVLHLALVRLSNECAVSCTVRDITNRGFRLQFIENVKLPQSCDIEIPVLAAKYRVARRWQSSNLAGVEIIDAGN